MNKYLQQKQFLQMKKNKDNLPANTTIEKKLLDKDSDLTIAFWDNCLCERGTTVAMYDYAYYNKYILKNRSIILYDSTRDDTIPLIVEKFKKEFDVFSTDNFNKVDKILIENKCDILYVTKAGANDNKFSNIVKTVIHVVFNCNEPHGNVYASISQWVHNNNEKYPVVPYIISLPDNNLNFRIKLGIPESATVFGRHGGYNQFDIKYVQDIVYQVALERSDIYFIFVNTEKFCNELPNIIHLDRIIDTNEKVSFINTCDAMIWGRSDGETFGLAIAEFSIKNKPVIATKDNVNDHAHIHLLKDQALWYTECTLKDTFLNFNKDEMSKKDWNAYREYTPEKVMKIFKEVFINN